MLSRHGEVMTQGLLTHRGYWRWSAGTQMARLPDAMAPLAFTAAAEVVSGSARAGGAMVAALVVAEVVCAVPVGRLLDRISVTRGARILLLARGVAYLGLLAAVLARLPIPALVALAAVPGALGASILGGFRALLSGVVAAPLLSRAVAVNAVITDAVIVTGPVLVAGLAALSLPAPLLAIAVTSALAVSLVPGTPSLANAMRPRGRSRLARPLLGWAIAAFALGHLCSTVEVAALPLAHRLGAGPTGASVLIAVFCATSMAGSLIYAIRKAAGTTGTAAALLAVMATGGTLIALSQGWTWVLTGLVVTGTCIGPLLTINSVQAEHSMPAHRRAEGFAVLNTAQGFGFATGSLTLALLPIAAVGLLAAATTLFAAVILAGLYRSEQASARLVANSSTGDVAGPSSRTPVLLSRRRHQVG